MSVGCCLSHKRALGHKNHTQENQTPQAVEEDMLSDVPFRWKILNYTSKAQNYAEDDWQFKNTKNLSYSHYLDSFAKPFELLGNAHNVAPD